MNDKYYKVFQNDGYEAIILKKDSFSHKCAFLFVSHRSHDNLFNDIHGNIFFM